MREPGLVSDQLHRALSEFAPYREYRAGRLPRARYLDWLKENAATLEARVGPRWARLQAPRYPVDFDEQAERFHADLAARGFVQGEPDKAGFRAFRQRVLSAWDHADKRTSIQPDEAALLYYLAQARRPRRMLAIGSYYGYFAVWALPAIRENGGQATLIDPNPDVCALAERNLAALGFADCAHTLVECAEDVLEGMAPGIDLVLLDPNGRPANDPAFRGKGIYALMVHRVFEKMSDGALLVAHNDYSPEIGPNEMAAELLAGECAKLEGFHAVCAERFRQSMILPTPEGIGVYLK
ncbi:MAG: hypothetical protein BWZ10_01127 [candidate division BRC1 bacterium ADurb.BinA364]|nr:MAG: hypothetical protein BWZ10_01127 [candidate division BRC1 bacterium ADurb.BinA364]